MSATAKSEVASSLLKNPDSSPARRTMPKTNGRMIVPGTSRRATTPAAPVSASRPGRPRRSSENISPIPRIRKPTADKSAIPSTGSML